MKYEGATAFPSARLNVLLKYRFWFRATDDHNPSAQAFQPRLDTLS
jgi:hypothetical protein